MLGYLYIEKVELIFMHLPSRQTIWFGSAIKNRKSENKIYYNIILYKEENVIEIKQNFIEILSHKKVLVIKEEERKKRNNRTKATACGLLTVSSIVFFSLDYRGCQKKTYIEGLCSSAFSMQRHLIHNAIRKQDFG